MSRINRNVYANAITNSLNDIDNNWVASGKPYRVYKFRKTSGIIRMTPAGELTMENDASLLPQNVNLYTGKEPVVVVWEGSTTLEVDTTNDTIIKRYSVGEYYEMYGVAPISTTTQNDAITFLSNDFITQFLDKSITLSSPHWAPSDNDMLDFVYMIIDERAKCYQWLEISSFIPNYNEETKLIENVEVSFNNINLKYASSGKSILDFFQFGSIGEGYAFPKETILDNGEGEKITIVEIDSELAYDKGSNSIQLDFMSGCALSSVTVYGRELSVPQKDKNTFLVPKTQRLFLYESQFPLSSPLFFNQPNSNSFWYEGANPTMTGAWESYREQMETYTFANNYNIGKTKTIIGGLKMNTPTVRATNPIVNGKYAYENWGNERMINLSGNYDFSAINGIKSADMKNSDLMTLCDFMNFNSYVNFSSDVFNYEFEETKKYKLTDTLGLVGTIMNFVIGGLDIGWTSTKSLAPSMPINVYFPSISFNLGMLGVAKSTTMPLDVFNDNKDESVVPLPTNVLTSFKFGLTDRILDSSQVKPRNPIGKGGGGVWHTKYIGQRKFEDGTWINDDFSIFEFNPRTTSALQATSDTKFIIDYIGFHAISQSDVKLSAYLTYQQFPSNEIKNVQVYSSLFETMSKARKDIRIWGNSMKLNFYDKFNTKGTIVWPKTEQSPKPSGNQRIVEGIELKNNVNNFSIPTTNPPQNEISVFYRSSGSKRTYYFGPTIKMVQKGFEAPPKQVTTKFLIPSYGDSYKDLKKIYMLLSIGGLKKTYEWNIGDYISEQIDGVYIRRGYMSNVVGISQFDKWPKERPFATWTAGVNVYDKYGAFQHNITRTGNFAPALEQMAFFIRGSASDWAVVGFAYECLLELNLNTATRYLELKFNYLRPSFTTDIPLTFDKLIGGDGSKFIVEINPNETRIGETTIKNIQANTPIIGDFTILGFYLEPK